MNGTGDRRLRFDDAVAIVTGAGTGLGREYALELAARGARVVVNDLGTDRTGQSRDAGPADEVVAEIERLGGRAVADHSDVRDRAAPGRLVSAAIDRWGRLDHVVANAGSWRDRSIARMTDDEFDDVLDVHLGSTFRLVRAAMPVMRSHGAGSIVLTGSTAGLFGTFGQANYAAAKAGLVGLTRVAALEGGPRGVRTNAIVPLAATRSATGAAGSDRMPPHRFSAAQVAAAVTALLHPSCTANGELLLAGGGWFSRVVLGVGPGWSGPEHPSAEAVLGHWDRIGASGPVSTPADGFAVLDVVPPPV